MLPSRTWALAIAWTMGAQTQQFESRAGEARSLIRDQRFSQARDLARQLVADSESAAGAETQQLATALELLAAAEIGNANNTKPVEELVNRAAAIEMRLSGEHSLAYSGNLLLRGRLFLSRSLYGEAVTAMEQAVKIQESLGAAPLELAEALHGLTRTLEGAGRYPEAIAAARRSLALRQAAAGADSREAGTGHYILGYSLQRVKPEEAESEFRQALALLEKHTGAFHPDIADTSEALGRLEYERKHYAESQQWYERVIAIVEKNFPPTHARFVSLLNNYGLSRKLQGDYAGCRQAFERALAISEATYGPENSRSAQVLANLGIVMHDMGDYPAALRAYERALAIQKRLLGEDHQLVGRIHKSMLRLHQVLGDWNSAGQHCRRAYSIFEKALGPDNEATLDTGNSCALLLNAMGRNQEALQIAQQTMERATRVHGADSFSLGQIHRTIGLIFFDLRQFGPAREHLERAAAMSEKHRDLRSQAIALRHLAVLDSQEKKSAQALAHATSAREIATRYFGSRSPDLPSFLRVEALALHGSGRRADAFQTAVASEELRQHSIRVTAGGIPERLALSYIGEDSPAIDLAQQWMTTPREQSQAFDLLVRGRNIVLDVMVARSREWRRQADPQTALDWELLKAARSQLAAVAIRAASGDTTNTTRDMERALAAKDRVESRLAANNPSIRDEFDRDRAGLDDVLRNLPPHTALVAYSAAERYRAFVASADGAVRAFDLGAASSIDSLVANWRKEILRERDSFGRNRALSEKTYFAAASALRRAVWDPLHSAIAGARQVFLVPDGGLLEINFLALPASETKYLAEAGPLLHVLNAERDLLPRPLAPTPARPAMLAVGNPAFDGVPNPAVLLSQAKTPAYRGSASSCSAFRDLRFSALPDSGTEALQSARFGRALGWDAEVLQGAAASERAIKQALRGQQVVHIATHGFFLDRECIQPGTNDNPLLRAGLALAGANHRSSVKPGEEDGVLTAEEAATLDLDGTEWLVLSGCDTGAGEIRAHEGVLGLRRAFQVAGAGTLISSLWSVRDDDARQWMKALYTARFQHKRSTAEAMADADRTELARRRSTGLSTHPFHWASFVASGDWR